MGLQLAGRRDGGASGPTPPLSRPPGWTVASLCAAVFLLTAEPSWAVDSATRGAARQLGYDGVAAYQQEDYAAALDKLERAYSVLKVPSLALWSARALEKSGKWVEASERYLEATRIPNDEAGDLGVQEKAKADAAAEREALLQRIPKVIVLIEGAEPSEVEVTIDGAPVNSALFGAGRPTNPGDIEVVGKLGERVVKGTVAVAEGDERSITLAFKKQPSVLAPIVPVPPPEETPPELRTDNGPPAEPRDSGNKANWQPVAGWTAVGVGAAGLIFGTVTGIVAINKNSTLSRVCVLPPGDVCPNQYGDDLSAYGNLKTMSSVGLIAGAVVAAAGVTLVLTAPRKNKSASASPYVGLASAGVKGTF